VCGGGILLSSRPLANKTTSNIFEKSAVPHDEIVKVSGHKLLVYVLIKSQVWVEV